MIQNTGHTASENTGDKLQTLFDFSQEDQRRQWTTVNDDVMGGISTSAVDIAEDSTALFSGLLSLENNGGFASVRTLPHDFKLAGFAGLRIRVKGDGRDYSFRIRTDDRFDGVAYQQTFSTNTDEWLEIDLPFDRFEAVFRGRPVRDSDPLDPARIRQLGFLIADKQAGKFSLRIDWIKASRHP